MSAEEMHDGKNLYEFGPFRVDPQKQTLLRSGEIVPLTPKTFQILLILVRHHKQVVTKDDLMKEVWPDTFVEESNLSRNIFMLRKALGKNPQDRYIVTVPGRGYRLAESVHLVPGQEVQLLAATHSKVQLEIADSKPWGWIALAAILTVVTVVGAWRWLAPRRTAMNDKDTVVLADFANSTGEPVFDEALRQGMAVELEQSPFLALISDQRVQHTLRMTGRAADSRLTPDVARDVCARLGSAAVIEGSITRVGSQYVVGLRAKNCRTGDVLDEEQVQAARKEDVLHALDQVARRFRKRVGESLATIEKHNTPLDEATTESLEALEAYSTGWKVVGSSGAAAALPLFRRAAEIDPNFAMAHASLGRMYADLDQSDLAIESTSRAWQLRNRVTDQENFFISAGYQTLVLGNLEAAEQTCETWARTYPRAARPHSLLSGMVDKAAGRYEKAAGESARSIELDPDFAIGYYGLAANQTYLGHLEEAENTLRRATSRGLEIDEFVMLDYDIAFLRGDEEGMKREAVRAHERTGGDNWISIREADAKAYSGHLKQARILGQRAVAQARQAGQVERAGLWEAGAAIRESFFENASEAETRTKAALAFSHDREAEFGAAYVLARVGRISEAEALADDLEKRFPEDTTIHFDYLPVLRARIALSQGQNAKAIELLQIAAPRELGLPRSSIDALFGALYAVYSRGEAYLALHRGAEAAAEFQKILDNRGIVVTDLVGALARLQLGRAKAMAGDTAGAKAAYQDFITLWNDADPETPLLIRAKAEFASLQ
jgi:DNA-binding winged helix-turn-helix (wHTH) protein/tetratricopeptide (TPR) repeat protein